MEFHHLRESPEIRRQTCPVELRQHFWIAFLPRTSHNLCYISWAIMGMGGQGEFGEVLQVYCDSMHGLRSYFECPHCSQRIGASTTSRASIYHSCASA